MHQSDVSFPLTDEQFEKLASLIESAALVAVSRALQKNPVFFDVAERGYANDKAAAKRALVGEA